MAGFGECCCDCVSVCEPVPRVESLSFNVDGNSLSPTVNLNFINPDGPLYEKFRCLVNTYPQCDVGSWTLANELNCNLSTWECANSFWSYMLCPITTACDYLHTAAIGDQVVNFFANGTGGACNTPNYAYAHFFKFREKYQYSYLPIHRWSGTISPVGDDGNVQLRVDLIITVGGSRSAVSIVDQRTKVMEVALIPGTSSGEITAINYYESPGTADATPTPPINGFIPAGTDCPITSIDNRANCKAETFGATTTLPDNGRTISGRCNFFNTIASFLWQVGATPLPYQSCPDCIFEAPSTGTINLVWTSAPIKCELLRDAPITLTRSGSVATVPIYGYPTECRNVGNSGISPIDFVDWPMPLTLSVSVS